jgi:hypothetical protein
VGGVRAAHDAARRQLIAARAASFLPFGLSGAANGDLVARSASHLPLGTGGPPSGEKLALSETLTA